MVDQLLGKDFETKERIIKSAFHEMETLLYAEIVTKRKSSHRVSNTFVHLRVIQLFEQLKQENVAIYKDHNFKASNGCIKILSSVETLNIGNEGQVRILLLTNISMYTLIFFEDYVSKILVPLPGQICDPLWGRFLPSHWYNIDQLPLPFVVSQEFTFTVNTDDNIHISCPNEALRKLEWTMHVIINAGRGL